MSLSEADRRLLAQAAELAFQCPPTARGFSVGCIIADADGAIIATGYSRELPGNMHAEEVAILKAREAGMDLRNATIYSSLEPCHPRLSGKTSCTQHILDAGMRRVVFGLREPLLYVDCTGCETLQAAGLDVTEDKNLREQVLAANPDRF